MAEPEPPPEPTELTDQQIIEMTPPQAAAFAVTAWQWMPPACRVELIRSLWLWLDKGTQGQSEETRIVFEMLAVFYNRTPEDMRQLRDGMIHLSEALARMNKEASRAPLRLVGA